MGVLPPPLQTAGWRSSWLFSVPNKSCSRSRTGLMKFGFIPLGLCRFAANDCLFSVIAICLFQKPWTMYCMYVSVYLIYGSIKKHDRPPISSIAFLISSSLHLIASHLVASSSHLIASSSHRIASHRIASAAPRNGLSTGQGSSPNRLQNTKQFFLFPGFRSPSHAYMHACMHICTPLQDPSAAYLLN